MQICKLIDGKPTDIQPIPQSIPGVSNPMLSDMISRGWLIHAPSDTPHIKASHWERQGDACVQVVNAVYSRDDLGAQATKAAEDEAAQQAAEDVERAAEALEPRDVQLGKATLRTHPDGSVELLSGPLILPGTATGAYEVWVDGDTGLVLTTLDHASPRKSKAEKDAAKAAKLAKVAAVKAASSDKDKLAALLDLLGLK
jgi:hypothetical protein